LTDRGAKVLLIVPLRRRGGQPAPDDPFGTVVFEMIQEAKRREARVSKKSSKNVLTEVSENVLMILFPLKPRELFETYFVRLIGTPNQQFQI
jgi:hypothetical protein